MKFSLVKTIRLSITMLLFLMVFGLSCNVAKAQSGVNVSLSIEKITAINTTERDCINFIFFELCNDVDETYFIVVGAKGDRIPINKPRISPPAPEDYYKFSNNKVEHDISLWNDSLQPNESVYLVVAIQEQDNGQLAAIEHLVTGAALTIGAIFWDEDLSSAAATELEAGVSSFVDSLSKSGDQTIGVFSVRIVNDGHSVRSDWKAYTHTNITLRNDNFASVNASGGSAKYSLDVKVNTMAQGNPVACRVFDDGVSNLSPFSEAIYFPAPETACISDGSSGGLCRRWFGSCVSTNDNVDVTFKLFSDGYNNLTQSAGAVYNRAPRSLCVPDGSGSGTCRKWFGRATTTDGRKVACYLFNDDLSDWIGPTDSIYYRYSGQVCMPNGSGAGSCRKWFGNCQVIE